MTSAINCIFSPVSFYVRQGKVTHEDFDLLHTMQFISFTLSLSLSPHLSLVATYTASYLGICRLTA